MERRITFWGVVLWILAAPFRLIAWLCVTLGKGCLLMLAFGTLALSVPVFFLFWPGGIALGLIGALLLVAAAVMVRK